MFRQAFNQHAISAHAVAAMLFFVVVFVGAVWAALRRRSQDHYQAMASLVLEDETRGNQR